MVESDEAPSESGGARFALAVEYEGSGFKGWQAQRTLRLATVQETVEDALSKVAATPIRVVCAGRTDAGVHASHQVVHFETTAVRPPRAWVLGGNTLLPKSVAIQWAQAVPADFHARFSATARRYCYVILNRAVRSAHFNHLATTVARPLDAERMHLEAQALLGEHDFSSFRGAGCQSRTAIRNVHSVSVTRSGDWVIVEIQANAFLLHMVRNVVGTLMAVGCAKEAPGFTAQVLALRDRKRAAMTAPAQGLYLVDVQYPAHFGLPPTRPGPAFLAPLLSG
jgi:tRNA pseudouridine38-40 synthase